ncbi:PIG-L deacetylase family protein [Robertmurraya andreesenii]|uniref:LmbE family N-acetylglucosaminyl deacetylase n=1 Tax=Anoxybacillus andreesenii TaxID=1325932 RepID=A0ABT9V7H6_9BACL|nr:PIG-L family deacetylase [Robertmurraya andreesenii]MDQ0156910.1 LmbE family N-acetylglucosaminyl deacetylase [Robertmurraya andreesenii]
MNNIIILTPHPDDETLGCGGTILRHKQSGDKVCWLIVTKMGKKFDSLKKEKRSKEITQVKNMYGFDEVYQLDFEAGNLDVLPLGSIINEISDVFNRFEPNIVYLPYRSDIHSDHRIVFDATVACTKWFRYPFVKRVLVYETLSETDFTINPDANYFHPNVFVDISSFIEKKIEIMSIYESELADHPFPRSIRAIKSLAYLRGSASGYEAAEAFMLLKERF